MSGRDITPFYNTAIDKTKTVLRKFSAASVKCGSFPSLIELTYCFILLFYIGTIVAISKLEEEINYVGFVIA
jgi:hypothetical protein